MRADAAEDLRRMADKAMCNDQERFEPGSTVSRAPVPRVCEATGVVECTESAPTVFAAPTTVVTRGASAAGASGLTAGEEGWFATRLCRHPFLAGGEKRRKG